MTTELKGTVASFDIRRMRSKTPGTASKKASHVRRAAELRKIKPGFPVETPFTTLEQMKEYLSSPQGVVCLRCGRTLRWVSGLHLRLHGWTVEEYREFYGLPWRGGLQCTETKGLRHENGKRSYDDGVGLPQGVAHRGANFFKKPKRVSLAKQLTAKRNLGVEDQYDRAEFLRVLHCMAEKDLTLKEARKAVGEAGGTFYYRWMREHPEDRAAYDAVFAALSDSAKRRAQRLDATFDQRARELLASGMTYAQVGKALGVCAMTVHHHLNPPTPPSP